MVCETKHRTNSTDRTGSKLSHAPLAPIQRLVLPLNNALMISSIAYTLVAILRTVVCLKSEGSTVGVYVAGLIKLFNCSK